MWKTSWTDLAPQVTATYQLSNAAGRETSLRAGWSLVFDEVTSPGANAFGAGAPYVSRRTSVSPPDISIDGGSALARRPRAIQRGRPGGLLLVRRRPSIAADAAVAGHARSSPRARPTGRPCLCGSRGTRPSLLACLPVVGGRVRINAFSDDGRSDYHAMLAQYVWRLSRGLQASLSYTWSHAIDLDSGDTLFPLPPPSLVPPSSNRGSADFDRRHVLHATASYRVPGHRAPEWLRPIASDWQIDVVAMVRSGTPLTITSSAIVGGQRLRVAAGSGRERTVLDRRPRDSDGRESESSRRFRPPHGIAPGAARAQHAAQFTAASD